MIFKATRRRTGSSLSHEHHTAAAFADLLQQFVGADERPEPLGGRLVIDRLRRSIRLALQKTTGLLVRLQE